jgi:hypothetical protein
VRSRARGTVAITGAGTPTGFITGSIRIAPVE